MARKKKEQVIKELTELGIEFDADGKYNALSKLLKESITANSSKPILITRDDESILELTPDLYKRARKIGLTDDQLKAYPDAVAVKAACDRMSPGSNPDAKVKAVVPPKAKLVEGGEAVPDMIEFESKMETSFMMGNRSSFDENNLRARLRKINRRYGTQHPVKIVKTTNFKQIKGKNEQHQNCKFYVTTYKIYLK